MKKNNLITITVIIAVIIIAFLILNKSDTVTETDAKCIGENSILYVQFGCHACEIQEEMFGENSQYLNAIDCFKERDKCIGITGTPTWKINDQFYKGVRSIEELKNLTKC